MFRSASAGNFGKDFHRVAFYSLQNQGESFTAQVARNYRDKIIEISTLSDVSHAETGTTDY